MITGKVTASREAIIELEVVGSTKQPQRIEAMIDTGFNGYLTLPSHLIRRLKLQLAGNRRATPGVREHYRQEGIGAIGQR